MSGKLLVVGDSYCMNYIRMRNHIHSGQWPNGTTRKESYELFDWKTKKVKQEGKKKRIKKSIQV